MPSFNRIVITDVKYGMAQTLKSGNRLCRTDLEKKKRLTLVRTNEKYQAGGGALKESLGRGVPPRPSNPKSVRFTTLFKTRDLYILLVFCVYFLP